MHTAGVRLQDEQNTHQKYEISIIFFVETWYSHMAIYGGRGATNKNINTTLTFPWSSCYIVLFWYSTIDLGQVTQRDLPQCDQNIANKILLTWTFKINCWIFNWIVNFTDNSCWWRRKETYFILVATLNLVNLCHYISLWRYLLTNGYMPPTPIQHALPNPMTNNCIIII